MTQFGEIDVPDGSQEQPILVDEDDDTPRSGIGFEVERLVRQVQKGDARFNPIDLDGDDENLSEDPWRADEESYDNDNAKIEREELVNEPEDNQDGPCVHWKKGIRNPCPCGTHQQVPSVTSGSIKVSKSEVFELKESVRVGRYEAEFLEVHEIWVPYKGGNVFVRGRTYARTRNLEGRIKPHKNEVCEIYELDENDHRAANPATYLEQTLVEVPIQNIKTIRTLHKTNKAFPECRFDRVRYRTKDERENKAPIICRWEMKISYPDRRYRERKRAIAGEEIRHYSENEIPKDRHRIPDSERRKPHEKIRGGSFIPNGAPKADPGASYIHCTPSQKFSLFDSFSGAGGCSKGAEMAGLKVLAACDKWPRCCETYRQNFPDVELHQDDIYEFIEGMSTDLTRERLNVDIVHFSPPCQTWSPAHTCEGKKDEENRATLYACEKIIIIFKPRIFTLEQTFGLAQERWIPNFNALLQGFTRHGYSVKWKVLHLVEYGLPQTRKRLVMIGAAPGEQLPPWPRPTHSKDPKDGQKPFVSALEACSALAEGENLHDVEGARPTDKVPWDSSTPLKWTITCSAGQCYHWSGQRGFTLAELAALQGFPIDFKFVGKCIKKQIGNAFAPIVVKVLLKSIRIHLENFDRVSRQPAPGQAIIVSDDDSDSNDGLRPSPRHKNLCQGPVESHSVVEELVGFCRKPSGETQELLRGMVKDRRDNPLQCFIAKADRKSSKSSSNPRPNPRRQTQPTQPTQKNTLDSYFVSTANLVTMADPASMANSAPMDTSVQMANGIYPLGVNAVVRGDSSTAPRDTGTALLAVDNGNTPAQDVTASNSNAPLHQIHSTPDETTTGQAAGRTINAGRITAPPRQSSPDSDEPRARRSAQSAITIADLNSSGPQTRSSTRRSTAGGSGGQTIVRGVLSAPARDDSDSDYDQPVVRRSARTARTIADLNNSPRQTRSGSLRSTGHRSARTAQTLTGLDEESSVGRSASSDAAARQQPRRTRRIVGGVITVPGRRSPPGFNDTPPLYQAPQRTQSVPNISQARQNFVRRARRSRRGFNDPAAAQTILEVEATAGVKEAAKRSALFRGLVEKMRDLQVAQGAAGPSSPGPQIPRTSHDNDVVTEPAAPMKPRRQSTSNTHHGKPQSVAPTPQGGLFEGGVSSSARQFGIRAAMARASQGVQAGEDVGGPSRRRSSRGSVTYMGESSRAGARPSLPFIVEDDEEEEQGHEQGDHDEEDVAYDADSDEEEDDDQKLQRGIEMSLEGASPVQETRTFDAEGFDVGETALAFEASVRDMQRRSQDYEPEDIYSAMDEDVPASAPEHESEPEWYGPNDRKGKGKAKAVEPRKFDDFAEDEENAEREGSPSKRPRGSK